MDLNVEQQVCEPLQGSLLLTTREVVALGLSEDDARTTLTLHAAFTTETDEGWNGEYIEDDPDDDLMLRFDVWLTTGEDTEALWPEGGSWCTSIPASTPLEAQRVLLQQIYTEAIRSASAGSFQTRMEELSHLGIDSLTKYAPAMLYGAFAAVKAERDGRSARKLFVITEEAELL